MARSARSAFRLGTLVPLALLLAYVNAGAVADTLNYGQVFTCVNGAGRTLTSDRLIGECMDREQRVLARDGSLVRIVPATLTADERAERDARERRAAAEKEAKLEAVKRDRQLMQRYPTEAEHTKARTSSLEDLQAAMKVSEGRIADLARERKPLLDEAEFYQNKAMPPLLKQQLETNEAAVSAQRDVQVQQRAEMDRIAKRYDAELAHLRRLWAGAAPGSIVSLAGPEASSPGKAARPIKPTATQSR
jgi:hypothetical protein